MEESTPKLKAVFIVNPISGVGRQKNIENLIQENLDVSRFEHSVVYTTGKGDATLLARQARQSGADLVVAVGGDGSVNEVAQALVNTETVMAIVPAGSGNGLANHLGIPINTQMAIQLLNHYRLVSIDTATMNGTLFVSIAGVGFDALVAEKFASSVYRGFVAYFHIILQEFYRYRPEKYRIVLDGKMYYYRAFLVAFANSGQFGYNTTIAPEAEVDDGFIDVCVVGKPGMIQLPRIVRSLFKKRINKTDLVTFYKAKEIRLFRENEGLVNIDGEAIPMTEELMVRVNPLSLKIVVP